MAGKTRYHLSAALAIGLGSLAVGGPLFAAQSQIVVCQKEMVNGTGVPQSGVFALVNGPPALGDPPPGNTLTLTGIAPNLGPNGLTEIDFASPSSIDSGASVKAGFTADGNTFEFKEWSWFAADGTGTHITFLPDPSFIFGRKPQTLVATVMLRNDTPFAERVEGGRFTQGTPDPQGVNIRNPGQGESPAITQETKSDRIPDLVMKPGDSKTFTIAVNNGGNPGVTIASVGPPQDSSGLYMFFRATLYLTSDPLRRNPVYLSIYSNPFGENPPLLFNPRHYWRGDVMTGSGKVLGAELLYVDAQDVDGSLPTIQSVEITPINHTGAVYFNPASDVALVPTRDPDGRLRLTIQMLAYVERAQFQSLPYRVRITAKNPQGESRTKDFTLIMHAWD